METRGEVFKGRGLLGVRVNRAGVIPDRGNGNGQSAGMFSAGVTTVRDWNGAGTIRASCHRF